MLGFVIRRNPETSERSLDVISKRIQSAIAKKFSCSTEIILRTTDDLRAVVKKNPFAKRSNIEFILSRAYLG